MAEELSDRSHDFLVPPNEPLIGVPVRHAGQDGTRFFASEAEADAALPPHAPDEALDLAGSWQDLPWEAMGEELDRIRHATAPSPPLEV